MSVNVADAAVLSAEAAIVALEAALAREAMRPRRDPFAASVRELSAAASACGARAPRTDAAAVARYSPNYESVAPHRPAARFGDAPRRGTLCAVRGAAARACAA